MDSVARWEPRDRADLFNEVGTGRGLANAIVEKDFWVCWTLKRLFMPDAFPGLVFKGGTSLSKGYGAIERFSEDIDLSFDRAGLGYGGDKDPENAKSAKKAAKLIEQLVADVRAHVAGPFLAKLGEEIAEQLGPQGELWSLSIDPNDPQTVNFRYPSSLAKRDYADIAYVNPVVRLELGARGDPWPAEKRSIRSYAADERPDVFKAPACEVDTLAVERTFWEKATILHAEHHRPADKATGERMSRHYYDLAMLARSGILERALERLDLLSVVAYHKALFFRSGWARYDEAAVGTLRLSPSEQRRVDLAADYAKMRPMFFAQPPSFDDILAEVAKLEAVINRQGENQGRRGA